MASLDVIGAIDNCKTMLSGLTAWQTICGVSSSADSAKRIHLGAIEDDGEQTPCPCIILDIDPFSSDWMPSTSHGRLTIEIRIELEIEQDYRGSFVDQYRWSWTKISAILAGINGVVNGSGQMMVRSITMPIPPGPINPDENVVGRQYEWGCVLNLICDFI